VASPTGDDEGSNVLINSSGREEVGATTPSGKALVRSGETKVQSIANLDRRGNNRAQLGPDPEGGSRGSRGLPRRRDRELVKMQKNKVTERHTWGQEARVRRWPWSTTRGVDDGRAAHQLVSGDPPRGTMRSPLGEGRPPSMTLKRGAPGAAGEGDRCSERSKDGDEGGREWKQGRGGGGETGVRQGGGTPGAGGAPGASPPRAQGALIPSAPVFRTTHGYESP